MKWTKVRFAALALGVVGASIAPFIFDLYVYRATSGYSGQRFTLHFANPPTEEQFLDAMIYSDPIFDAPETEVRQWREARVDGQRLMIKMDDQLSACIKPFDPCESPDLTFDDGARVRGVWLTEPSTRNQIPVPLVMIVYMGVAFACVALAGLALLRILCFLLHLTRSGFCCVRRSWSLSLIGLYLKRRTLEERKRIEALEESEDKEH